MSDYKVTSEVKLIRRTHQLRLTDRTTGLQLKEFVSRLPDFSVFEDFESDESGLGVTIVFREEVMDRDSG